MMWYTPSCANRPASPPDNAEHNRYACCQSGIYPRPWMGLQAHACFACLLVLQAETWGVPHPPGIACRPCVLSVTGVQPQLQRPVWQFTGSMAQQSMIATPSVAIHNNSATWSQTCSPPVPCRPR